MSFSIMKIRYFLYQFVRKEQQIFFFSSLSLNSNKPSKNTNSLFIVFKDKVSDFIDGHLFLQLWQYLGYTLLYMGKPKK